MRYIYIVAGLILIIIGLSGITFLKVGLPPSKELARVNERVISVDEFEKILSESRTVSPSMDKRRFLDDLLTREMLMQEAKRRGLDLKEPFRRSIQNYYEQTLLKDLTQEKMSEIRVSVSEEEIGAYYRNKGKVYEVRIAVLPTEAAANEAITDFPVARTEKRKLRLEDIPPAIADAVASLKVGEVSKKPVPRDTGFFVFRLEGFTTDSLPPLAAVHDEIRRTIEERKKSAEMEKWLNGLREKSKITVNEALLK
ncbi:MAG TPA: peptidylprolyl isomerase [Thermodesulfovibrionales bacterium]|nr:peptidylprolyl isomerase [Thermodesulfovibrionales bacterium]